MRLMIGVLIISTIMSNNVLAQASIPREGEIFFSRAMREINIKHSNWVRSTATGVKQNNSSQQAITQQATKYGSSFHFGNMQIETLIILVMMQVAREHTEDQRQLLEEMKQQNEKKKALRDVINKMKSQQSDRKEMLISEYDSLRKMLPKSNSGSNSSTTAPVKPVSTGTMVVAQKVTPAQVAELKTQLMEEMDTVSGLSEMISIKMQMYQDRYNKFLAALSNMLKKLSDSADSIIANMK